MRWWLATFVLLLASAAHAQTESDYSSDEAVLREQNLPTKGAELLPILRGRIPSVDTIAQFKKHVAGLAIRQEPKQFGTC